MVTLPTRAAPFALVAGLALGALVLAAACSDAADGSASDSSAATPASASDAAAFATRAAAAACSALRQCCGAQTYRYDADACSAALAPTFLRMVAPVLTGRKVAFDARAADACIQAAAARMARCDDGERYGYREPLLADVVLTACTTVVRPTVARGGRCSDAVECATSSAEYQASCVEDTTSDGGTSYSYPYVPAPTVCIEAKLGVAPGGACSLYPSSSVDYQASRCDEVHGYCAPNPKSTAQTGTCRAFASVGDPCVSTPDAPIYCGPAAYCDVTGSTGVCTRRRDPGQPCEAAGECTSNVCANLTTDADSGVRQGRCGYPDAVPRRGNPWEVTPSTCASGPSAFYATADGATTVR